MAHAGGRPTTYTEDLANEICRRIMEGESLRSIVETEGMPNRSTVHLWLATKSQFSDQYARAREDQADTLADELIELADNATDVNKARLQIDTRKWAASKLKPKKYGDKLDMTTNGKDLPIPILGGMAKNVSADNSDQEAIEA